MAALGYAPDDIRLGWTRCCFESSYGPYSGSPLRFPHAPVSNLWWWKKCHTYTCYRQAVVWSRQTWHSSERVWDLLPACISGTRPWYIKRIRIFQRLGYSRARSSPRRGLIGSSVEGKEQILSTLYYWNENLW